MSSPIPVRAGTRAAQGDRYHWTVSVLGKLDPVVAGHRHGGSLRRHGLTQKGRHSLMPRAANYRHTGGALLANGSLAQLFRRVLDALAYWAKQARFWAVGRGMQSRARDGVGSAAQSRSRDAATQTDGDETFVADSFAHLKRQLSNNQPEGRGQRHCTVPCWLVCIG